ncbi:MAG TPA: DUF3971 domain-containing protein [Stellaceae bacterium]|nr:DUF3971 domain-containing protein [Stellaceae bacterium]
MRLTRRIAALALKSAGAAMAFIVLALGVLFLRLDYAPLSLSLLTPALERALSPADGAFRLRIAGTVLSLAEDRRSVELQARGIRFEDDRGAAIASVPDFILGLSLDALFHGMLAPTRIIVDAPRLHVVRGGDGAFELGIGGGSGTSGALTQFFRHDFLAAPDRARPLGYLKEVRIRGASLDVADRFLGTQWQAPRASATFLRGPAGASGSFALAVAVEGSTAALSGDFRYVIAEHRLTAQLALAGWDLSKLRRVAPVLTPAAGLRVPIGGTVVAIVDTAGGGLREMRVDLTSWPGSVLDPRLGQAPIAVGYGSVRARYEAAAARVTLESLALDLGGPALALAGTIDGVDSRQLLRDPADWQDRLAIAVEATVRHMPADDLARFWPPDLAPPARDWVTRNIRDGSVEEAHLAAKLELDPRAAFAALPFPDPPPPLSNPPPLLPNPPPLAGEGRVGAAAEEDKMGAAAAVRTAGGGRTPDFVDAVTLDELSGAMTLRGLTVDYLAPLPPVRGVDGTAVFDRSRMVLTPTAGALAGIRLRAGSATITDLDKKDQDIDIQLDVEGPLRDALDVLDAKPFRYAHELGIDPARVAGAAAAHLAFKFPLDHRTTLDQVAIAAKATLSGVALGGIVLGEDLSEGELRLDLDRAGLRLDGKAKIAGAPATIGWQQNFKPVAGVRSRYTVESELDDATRRRLGLALDAVKVAGPLAVEASVTTSADRRGAAQIALDAGRAAVAVPDLAWTKPAGSPATARFDLALAEGRIAAIRAATLASAGADIRLSAAFDAAALRRLELQRFRLGETEMTGTILRRAEGGWRADLRGAAFDASGLAAGLTRPRGAAPEPPLVLDAQFGRLILGPKREARDATLQLYSDGRHWQSARFDAAPWGEGKIELRFGEAGGKRPFTFETSDLGAALRLFDISDHLAGGRLAVTGEAQDAGAARKFVGHIDGGQYRIVHAPALAKLLALASFSGIASLLSGDGIPFDRLTGDFTAEAGRIAVSRLRAWGGALGVTTDGSVDLGRGTLDLAGTIVPAYRLNSLLGNIPVIGNLLQGGEGQGLFAANFRAAGALDDPAITVNPLSALAPGFLRNLFLFDAPGQSAAPAKPEGDAVK